MIFLSLKDVAGLTYAEAEDALVQLIGSEAGRFHFLTNSSALSDAEKEQYRGFTIIQNGKYRMDKGLLISALRILSQLLYRHYGQKVIILIDEYDVPLDKAFQHGYYQEMVSLIRGMFGQALKTNSFLQFAVLTGCLRISKESILQDLTILRFIRQLMPDMTKHLDLQTRRSRRYWQITNCKSTMRRLRNGTMVIISEMQIFIALGM